LLDVFVFLIIFLILTGTDRNANLTVMVCKTESECDDNAGAVCGEYEGPPATIAELEYPLIINCPSPLQGKFVRVRQQLLVSTALSLTEVLVFSPII